MTNADADAIALHGVVHRDANEHVAHVVREFNRTTHPDRSVEVSLDLGESPGDHNRIEVATGGVNYRRLLTLEGSDDGKTWKPILDKRPLTYFTSDGTTFDGRQVSYAVSRYRYLRVRIAPDPALQRDTPDAPARPTRCPNRCRAPRASRCPD